MVMGFRIQHLFNICYAVRIKNCSCSDISGFSLVETIVALVILFTCLGAASLSYNTAIDLVRRTDSVIQISDVQSDIRAIIRGQLFSGITKEKDISYSDDITYSWESVRSKSSRNIIAYSQENLGELNYGKFYLSLYSVSLIINCINNGQSRQAEYNYQELIWDFVS